MQAGESFVVDDGYTVPGYLEAVPGLHPALRFEYRPIQVMQRDAVDKSIASKGSAHAHQVVRSCVASRLTHWNAVDLKGEPLPIEPANVGTLPPLLYDKLFNVLLGYRASDPDPTATKAEQNEEDEALLQSAMSGRSVAAVKEAADEKN